MSAHFYNIAIQAAVRAGKRIMEIYHGSDFQITEKSDHSPLTLADRAAHEIILSQLQETGLPILSEEGRNIPYEERKSWKNFWLVDPLDGTKEFIKRNGEFTVNIALIEKNKPRFGVVYAPVPDELFLGIPGSGSWMVGEPTENLAMDRIRTNGKTLPLATATNRPGSPYRVVASRSHRDEKTEAYLAQLETIHGKIELVPKGSSLKLCMVATGNANEYPRLGPTMEWDTAAAHAVVKGAGKSVTIFGTEKALEYNKKDLLNPHFLVK